jgi:hypothetical protein
MTQKIEGFPVWHIWNEHEQAGVVNGPLTGPNGLTVISLFQFEQSQARIVELESHHNKGLKSVVHRAIYEQVVRDKDQRIAELEKELSRASQTIGENFCGNLGCDCWVCEERRRIEDIVKGGE